MKKYWVIMSSRGSYDDYVEWISGIFDTEEEAVALAEKLDKRNLLSSDELDKLPLLYTNSFGEGINTAELLFDGNGIKGDEFENGGIENGGPRPGVLEKLHLTREEFDRYQEMYYYAESDYDAVRVISYEAGNGLEFDYKIHPVYNGIDNPCIKLRQGC